jgi:hypothetical protein
MTCIARARVVGLAALAAAGIALSAWLFVRTQPPAFAGELCSTTAGVPSTVVSTASRVDARQLQLALINRRAATADDTVRVQQGESVVLTITSDQLIALHLHGLEVGALEALKSCEEIDQLESDADRVMRSGAIAPRPSCCSAWPTRPPRIDL